MPDLKEASKSLVQALMIREKYMAMSHQSFPKITARFLQNLEDKEEFQGMKEGFGKGSGTGQSLDYVSVICCLLYIVRFIYFFFKIHNIMKVHVFKKVWHFIIINFFPSFLNVIL